MLRKQPQGSQSGTLISTHQTETLRQVSHQGREDGLLPAAKQPASLFSSNMTPVTLETNTSRNHHELKPKAMPLSLAIHPQLITWRRLHLHLY